jgi:hypothetical protein
MNLKNIKVYNSYQLNIDLKMLLHSNIDLIQIHNI